LEDKARTDIGWKSMSSIKEKVSLSSSNGSVLPALLLSRALSPLGLMPLGFLFADELGDGKLFVYLTIA